MSVEAPTSYLAFQDDAHIHIFTLPGVAPGGGFMFIRQQT
jgi:hypothetical protein